MSTEIEMPKYKSLKTVHALKIKDMSPPYQDGSVMITPEDGRYASFETRPNYDARIDRSNCPDDDMGYYVVYEGGFTSWSPTDVFESNHRLIER